MKVQIQYLHDFAGSSKISNRVIFLFICIRHILILIIFEFSYFLYNNNIFSFGGIENHLVRGLWKTICQEPGEKVETKTIWNIVSLESGWRFVQPGFTPVKYFNRFDEN